MGKRATVKGEVKEDVLEVEGIKVKEDVIKSAPKVTYSESFKVNIGDYESREVFISVTRDLEDDDDSIESAISSLAVLVKKKLYAQEKKFRYESQGNVDFDTKGKLLFKKSK